MKSRSTFEERLVAASGETPFKQAKQLLKSNQLQSSFRDEDGALHGCFSEKGSLVHSSVMPGDHAEAECDCGAPELAEGKLCAHAVALLLNAARFHTPEPVAEENDASASYLGLKNAGLEALAADCAAPQKQSMLFIQTEAEFPHVPSKWENAVLTVRLRSDKREYLGNLNNLRQLFFDKTLAVTLKLNTFSLQEQQIIRFLAINAEPENSNLLLNSEQTAEFFHILGGFERFTRHNRRLIIHNEASAVPVILRLQKGNLREYVPGIRFQNALLEVRSAKVITGRSGCWVGRDGEYFWIPAELDIGFLRNFFRLGRWTPATPGALDFLKRSPLVQYDLPITQLPEEKPALLLSGKFAEEVLTLNFELIYRHWRFAPDGGRLQQERGQFWRRNECLERQLANDLAMFQVEGTFPQGQFLIRGIEKIGMFLERVLPMWRKRVTGLVLDSALTMLTSGSTMSLPEVGMDCSFLERTENGNWKMNYALHAGDRPVCWNTMLQTAKQNGGYLTDESGRFLCRLPHDATERLQKLNTVITKLDAEKQTFEVPHVLLNYYHYLTEHWPHALPESLYGQLIPADDSANQVTPSDTPAPAVQIAAELRSYQQEGVQWMLQMFRKNFNVILADEMGLGKTLQALVTVAKMRGENAPPALVIAPASLVENWHREANRFLPDYKVGAVSGETREEILEHIGEYDLVVLSYAIARREIARLTKKHFSFVILDEAQHIKNPGTANAQSCKALKSEHRLVLTGTPLENSPDDLWSIFDFLHPGLLGTFHAFKKNYSEIAGNAVLQQDLAARVAPFIKRRNKADVAPELPPKEEHTYFCQMGATQQALYDSILSDGRAQLAGIMADHDKKGSANRHGNFEILTTLLRLRQVCCHPALLPNDLGAGVDSAKMDLFQELLLEHLDSGHKVLLFSQFTSLLSLVRTWLDHEKIRYCYLDGSTRNRQNVVDEFNNTPEIPLFLLSLKAGGTGLNLTSADTVVIFDPWWNPAVELQAADRTHRIGQTRSVRTLKLLVKDSIEEKILKMQTQKQELFDHVVDNPAIYADKFTLDELKYLLQ